MVEIGGLSNLLENIERRVLEFRSSVQYVEAIRSRLFLRWWIHVSLKRGIGVANSSIVHPLHILKMIRKCEANSRMKHRSLDTTDW